MQRLVGIFLLVFSFSGMAELPEIIAFVNDQPITRYDFESRKKMLVTLNDLDLSNPEVISKVNSSVLNNLIDEEIFNQYAKKIGREVSKQDLDNAIASIEEKNNMPKGGLNKHLIDSGLDIYSFRKQIRGELIKSNIISSLSQSISVFPNEVDIALINSYQDFDVEAWVFTSRTDDKKSQDKMHLLKKRFSSCNSVDNKLFADFADGEKFDRKLSKLPLETQSVILDTKVGTSSSIYKQDGAFKMVFVCKKESGVSKSDLTKIKSFLSHKKMSQKSEKFFKDLRTKSNIKILIPGL
jgi:hypothetical protein